MLEIGGPLHHFLDVVIDAGLLVFTTAAVG